MVLASLGVTNREVCLVLGRPLVCPSLKLQQPEEPEGRDHMLRVSGSSFHQLSALHPRSKNTVLLSHPLHISLQNDTE